MTANTAPEFAAETAESECGGKHGGGYGHRRAGRGHRRRERHADVQAPAELTWLRVRHPLDFTGQLMTMADLDFETKTSYSVTVTAR